VPIYVQIPSSDPTRRNASQQLSAWSVVESVNEMIVCL
jgi:hypothetical protein